MAETSLPATVTAPSSFGIKSVLSLLAAAVALTVINVAITLTVLDRYGFLKNQEVVSLDAATMIMGFVAAQGADVSEEELQSRIRALNANLDEIVATFANERGVIVVNSAAVLGGTRDVTPDMLASLGLQQ